MMVMYIKQHANNIWHSIKQIPRPSWKKAFLLKEKKRVEKIQRWQFPDILQKIAPENFEKFAGIL